MCLIEAGLCSIYFILLFSIIFKHVIESNCASLSASYGETGDEKGV